MFCVRVVCVGGNVTDLPDSQSHPERIVAQDITCSENAQSTMDCSFNGMIDTECSNVTRAVAISCRANCKLYTVVFCF